MSGYCNETTTCAAMRAGGPSSVVSVLKSLSLRPFSMTTFTLIHMTRHSVGLTYGKNQCWQC